MQSVLATLVSSLTTLGYAGLFTLMGLESAGAPIPAEIVLPFAGYLVFSHQMGFLGAMIAANLGGLAGFLLQYALGRYGGRPLLRRFGHYLLISPKHLEEADRWFGRYGGKAVFLARLLPIVRGLISLPAGAARMPLGPFVLWSLAGAFPWTLGLILAGWGLGALWPAVTKWAHAAGLYLLLAAALPVAIWVVRRRRSRMADGRRAS